MTDENTQRNQAMILMTRRDFVKATALLAAGPSFAGAAEPTHRIRVGFLGVAHSHAAEKVKVIRASPDWELVGVAAEEAKLANAYAQQGLRILKEDDLLRECEVIIVESAVRDLASLARRALQAGKHVHIEKPPAATMRDFEALVKVAREKQRLLQVGYMWRFNPGFNAAITAARQGWLGDVYLVRATMNTQLSVDRRPEWAEFKGGAMFEQGCHLIDSVVRLLGKPKTVTPHLQRRGGDDLADNCIAVLEFTHAQAIVTNSVLQPNAGPHRFLEVLGTNGTAIVKPIEPPVLRLDLAKAAGPYNAGSQTIPWPDYRRYVGEFAELAEATRARKPLSVSLEEELTIQETLLRACQML